GGTVRTAKRCPLKTSLTSAGHYLPTTCWAWSWAAPYCWSPRSGPLSLRDAAWRDCDEPRERAGELPYRGRDPLRPGNDRLLSAAQPDHHVPFGRDDAARRRRPPG